MNEWVAYKIETTAEALPVVEGYLVEKGIGGLQVYDPADIELLLSHETGHWDYVAPEVTQTQPPSVTFYLPKNGEGRDMFCDISAGLSLLQQENPSISFGSLSLQEETLLEEDWETSWKQYYAPFSVGEQLLICPEWEVGSLQNPEHRKLIILDPGMAFGTGGHATTRMCLELLEQSPTGNAEVLDLGCGSGILSIAALLLGAASAFGVDIDEKAVNISMENATLSGVAEQLSTVCGDVFEEIKPLPKQHYNLICANLVADLLIPLFPQLPELLAEGGIILASGIISERAEEVKAAAVTAGLKIKTQRDSDDWTALLLIL